MIYGARAIILATAILDRKRILPSYGTTPSLVADGASVCVVTAMTAMAPLLASGALVVAAFRLLPAGVVLMAWLVRTPLVS